MKLAGLTWWRNNYGSILQAYALQCELQKYDEISYEIINQFGKKTDSIDNLMGKLKHLGIKKTMQRVVWKFGMKGLRRRVKNMQAFVDDYLHVSDEVYNDTTIGNANAKYDGFICGSDQIWNPTLSKLDSIYWLRFAEDGKKKYAYAPSIGLSKVKPEDAGIIRDNLKDFDFISCREANGAKAINEVLDDQFCETVVDPTILVDPSTWDDIVSERKIKEKYIFVYFLRGTKKTRKIVEAFSKKVGLPIVTIPFLENEKIVLYDFKFGDYKYWDASPADFISLIKNAEYVFSDSFHCMVFSCLNHTPFYLFPKIGKNSTVAGAQMDRLRNMQAMLGLDGRIIDETISIEQLLNMKEIDWNHVDECMKAQRERSQNLLKNALRK